MERRAIVTLAALLGIAGGCTCGGTSVPPIRYDGNIIVGDASQSGEVDGELSESGAGDVALSDGGPVGNDAQSADRSNDQDGQEPDLGCNMSAEAVLTSSEALGAIGRYENHVVEITGTSTAGALACTGGPCADGGSCCATCTATVTIDRLIPLLPSACFGGPGCRGNECTQVCRPPVIGLSQSFRGRLVRSGGGNGVALELFAPPP